jgi:hypothetical protein
MSTDNQSCEASRGSGSVAATDLHASCFLCDPCRGDVTGPSHYCQSVPRNLKWHLEDLEVGVGWLSACRYVSPGAAERPLLEDFTKQHSQYPD